jgi:hypothetical protein
MTNTLGKQIIFFSYFVFEFDFENERGEEREREILRI